MDVLQKIAGWICILCAVAFVPIGLLAVWGQIDFEGQFWRLCLSLLIVFIASLCVLTVATRLNKKTHPND